MITIAQVNLWDKQVGAVSWDNNSAIGYFEYNQDFIQSGLNIAPLMMPINSNYANEPFSFRELLRSTTFHGMPGLLADVLPDRYGNELIDAWLMKNRRLPGSMNPVEKLCFIGKRGMGALEFEPQIPKAGNTSTKIEIKDLIEVSHKLLNNKLDFKTNLSNRDEKALLDILKIGTSAGGARPKAVIAYNEKTKEIRSGQTNVPDGFKHYLIKFDGVSDAQFGTSTDYGRVEMAYYLMAKDAGVQMMDCHLLEENGRAHFMTRRFDRKDDNSKLHYQSLCAMQHMDFNNISMYSYEQVFQTLRMLELPFTQAEQLFTRMVFNVVARNCDDHTKNFGFLMDKDGSWNLSPAFDICYSYRPGSYWVSQQSLSVNGERHDISKQDLIEVASKLDIKKGKAIISLVNEVVQNWDHYAKQVDVKKDLANLISKNLINFEPEKINIKNDLSR